MKELSVFIKLNNNRDQEKW